MHNSTGERTTAVHRSGYILCLLLFLGLTTSATMAAEVGADLVPAPTPEPGTLRSSARMVAFGMLGGGLGFMLGAVLGANYGQEEGRELSGLDDAFYVGSTLGAVGLATGVHAGDDSLGDFGWVVLTTAGIGAAGIATAFTADEVGVLWLTVVAQCAGAVIVERATAHGNLRVQQATVAPTFSVAPFVSREHRPGMVVTCRF